MDAAAGVCVQLEAGSLLRCLPATPADDLRTHFFPIPDRRVLIAAPARRQAGRSPSDSESICPSRLGPDGIVPRGRGPGRSAARGGPKLFGWAGHCRRSHCRFRVLGESGRVLRRPGRDSNARAAHRTDCRSAANLNPAAAPGPGPAARDRSGRAHSRRLRPTGPALTRYGMPLMTGA